MPKIDPNALKHLRSAKGWSQEELAERTKAKDGPKIDKQTIWRLEQGGHTNTRDRTIQQLARALNADPAVLTGQAKLPNLDDDAGYFLMSKLNFRVSYDAHNALFLVSERYNVTHQEIVELAPFLYCWAAEASLQQRRDRLEKAEAALEGAKSVEADIRHLPSSDFTSSEEKFAIERESIDSHDIFGMALNDDGSLSNDATYNEGTDNPFAVFLSDLAQDVGPTVSFEACPFRGFPEYRVCPKEAGLLAGGDSELAEEILTGHLLLNEMPKELRQIELFKERTEWVRAKVEEFRAEMRRMSEQRNIVRSKGGEVSP
jgi:transcriptional regulator with XRE-family HTH domain